MITEQHSLQKRLLLLFTTARYFHVGNNAIDIYFLVVNYDLVEKRICRKHHYQQLIVSLLYKQLDTKCLALVEYWSIRM